jgi:hypothetical protein
MESTIHHQYDGALAFRAPGSADITADTVLTKMDLHLITGGARPLGDLVGRYGEGAFDVVVVVKSFDFTTMDESYVLEFTTYDSAGANPVIQASHTVAAGEVGKHLVFTFHPEQFQVLDSDAAQFSINVNVGGTTPIINLFAFAAPASHVV